MQLRLPVGSLLCVLSLLSTSVSVSNDPAKYFGHVVSGQKRVEVYESEEWELGQRFYNLRPRRHPRLRYKDKSGRPSLPPDQIQVPEGWEWADKWQVFEKDSLSSWWDSFKTGRPFSRDTFKRRQKVWTRTMRSRHVQQVKVVPTSLEDQMKVKEDSAQFDVLKVTHEQEKANEKVLAVTGDKLPPSSSLVEGGNTANDSLVMIQSPRVDVTTLTASPEDRVEVIKDPNPNRRLTASPEDRVEVIKDPNPNPRLTASPEDRVEVFKDEEEEYIPIKTRIDVLDRDLIKEGVLKWFRASNFMGSIKGRNKQDMKRIKYHGNYHNRLKLNMTSVLKQIGFYSSFRTLENKELDIYNRSQDVKSSTFDESRVLIQLTALYNFLKNLKHDFNYKGYVLGTYMSSSPNFLETFGLTMRLKVSQCFQSWEMNEFLPLITLSTCHNTHQAKLWLSISYRIETLIKLVSVLFLIISTYVSTTIQHPFLLLSWVFINKIVSKGRQLSSYSSPGAWKDIDATKTSSVFMDGLESHIIEAKKVEAFGDPYDESPILTSDLNDISDHSVKINLETKFQNSSQIDNTPVNAPVSSTSSSFLVPISSKTVNKKLVVKKLQYIGFSAGLNYGHKTKTMKVTIGPYVSWMPTTDMIWNRLGLREVIAFSITLINFAHDKLVILTDETKTKFSPSPTQMKLMKRKRKEDTRWKLEKFNQNLLLYLSNNMKSDPESYLNQSYASMNSTNLQETLGGKETLSFPRHHEEYWKDTGFRYSSDLVKFSALLKESYRTASDWFEKKTVQSGVSVGYRLQSPRGFFYTLESNVSPFYFRTDRGAV